MVRRGVRWAALLLVGLVAFLYLVATYGTALPGNPFAPVPLQGPIVADSDGTLTVVADDRSGRVLILDEVNDLTGVVDCTAFDSRIDAVTDVRVSGGLVYVAGVQFYPDSAEIAHERIVVYGPGGEFLGVAYEEAENYSNSNVIKGLFAAEGGVVAVTFTDDELVHVFASREGSRVTGSVEAPQSDIFDVAFCAQTGNYAALSSRGLFNDDGYLHATAFGDRVFTAIDLAANDDLYACDDVSGAACVISGDSVTEFASDSRYDDVHVNNSVVCLNASNDNVVEVCGTGHDKGPFTFVHPSAGFRLRMLGVWASALYLVVLIVAGVVRRVRAAIKEDRVHQIGPLFTSATVVIALGVAIATLFYDAYQTQVDRRTKEVGMCADHLADQVDTLSAAMEYCDDRTALRGYGDQLVEVAVHLDDATSVADSIVNAARKNGIGMYYVLYGQDDQGIFYIWDSDGEHVMGTDAIQSSVQQPLTNAFSAGWDGQPTMHDGTSLRDDTRYRLVPIPTADGNDVAGVIELGTKVRAFNTLLVDRAVQLLLALLVAMIVVYLSYSEIRALARSVFAYRRLQGERPQDAIAALTRPFMLCVTLLTNIDAVLTPLVARTLLQSSGMDRTGLLLALPAIMMGVGLVAGQLLYGTLGSRVGLRRLVCSGLGALLITAAATAASVALGGFWHYCAARLLMSVALGLLYALGYSLPQIAHSDTHRERASGAVERTDVSAVALGTVLGSSVAQALGHEWIYASVALACIPLIVTILGLLPRDMGPLERHARLAESLLALRRRGGALAVVALVALPAAVAAGYATFLFPLFASGLGMAVLDINNVYVLGLLAAYVCMDPLVSLRERYGARACAAAGLGLLGIVFVLFSFNTTLVWSIVVVFFVGLLGKLTDGWESLWLAIADEAGVSAAYATSTMLGVRNVAMVLRTFILGVLLGGDDAMPVVVVGFVCVICAALFVPLSRKFVVRGA